MIVTLEWYELNIAAKVGVERRIKSMYAGRKDAYGYDGDDIWTMDIEGAAGEMTVAKALGVYWSGSVNTFKIGGDVGTIQVRTAKRDTDRLIVRGGDDDDSIFVLVIGRAPKYRIAGWIRGAAAKCHEWMTAAGNGRPAAYFVPQSALQPIETLTQEPTLAYQ